MQAKGTKTPTTTTALFQPFDETNVDHERWLRSPSCVQSFMIPAYSMLAVQDELKKGVEPSAGKGSKRKDPPPEDRNVYTNTFACKVLDWLDEDKAHSIANALVTFKIRGRSTVTRWKQNADVIRKGASKEMQVELREGRGRSHRTEMTVAFETQLVKLLRRRRAQGQGVSPRLIRHILQRPKWLERIAQLQHVWKGRPVVYSYRWMVSFLHRHKFAPVKATNVRAVDLQKASAALGDMVIMFRHSVLKEWRNNTDQPMWYKFHPTEGRFPLWRRLNYDQVPLQFVFTSKSKVWAHSSERKHHKGQVKVKTPGAHLAKRQATLQVAITGDPDMPQPPLTVIFRGQGNVSETEKMQYDPRVKVLWQSKAWMDRKTNLKWVSTVLADYLKSHYRVSEDSDTLLETLGICDSLDSQTHSSFNETCRELNHRPLHGPKPLCICV